MWARRRGRGLAMAALVAMAGGCGEPGVDGDDDDLIGGKADGVFGIDEGSAEALAILRLANEASFTTLDDAVKLDRRAAQGIIDRRVPQGPDDEVGYQTLQELDRVPRVAKTAFGKLLTFVRDEDLVARRLRVASLNLRWFGLDGDLFGSLGSETRTDSIRAFIDDNFADHDVMVFQEVVDLELFTDALVPDRTCHTYTQFTGKHQRVVVCHRDEFEFRMPDDDDNFAFEALNTGRIRPGVHGTVVSAQGTPILNLMAVHLKAREDSTDRRLEQAEILAERVDAVRASAAVPYIAIGDFNTHLAEHTGLTENDEDLMGEILEDGGNLRRVELPVPFTYREKDGTAFRLDQAWVSPEIDVLDVAVHGPCSLDFATGEPEIVEFFDTVSDHCMLTLEIDVP